MNFEQALALVRLMMDHGVSREDAINNQVIADSYRERIRETLNRDENIILEPARFIISGERRDEWLRQIDRQDWHYWPSLRTFLLGLKGWTPAAVRSLDETTDRTLAQLEHPAADQFDIRGLVVGYVQSGKTANYTALIAKAADVGYRLIIVLAGIDNGLRRQTQIRLNKELVGYADHRIGSVRLPPMGRQWHQFTTEDIGGDFRPGFANPGALQGTQPVLLVIKKNGTVLRRLHTWLDSAPEDVRQTLPVLLIDDEADQASVDTRGTYQAEGEPIPEDYEEPSVINGLIRDLLRKFQRKVYIAYTATPFANILIPHDTFDPTSQNDLYPKDFVVDLPKPDGYFGSEELFGRFDITTGTEVEGLDVIRRVPVSEFEELSHGSLPATLENAMIDFVLAGAARAHRGNGSSPATMLIHGSHLVLKQMEMFGLVNSRFSELRDEWRYQRNHGILTRLTERWENEFRPIITAYHLDRDVPFTQIEPFIGQFLESVIVQVINSYTGTVLDYEREPGLKAIAVGGNRLSRGLTLEGLLVSYFVRATTSYDTLMQMGRWFGFRAGYEDLTRIYMTNELAGWFGILAMVEYELRQDIQVYESQNITPLQLGTRIIQHPAMLVTSRLKQRYAQPIVVEQSYSNKVLQTIRFPFDRPDDLIPLLDTNMEVTRSLISNLGEPHDGDVHEPIWLNISPDRILEYLERYQVDEEARNISLPLICAFIRKQNEIGELVNWTIGIKGRGESDRLLREIDLGLNRMIPMMSRTRLRSDPNSLGVVTEPGDELTGLTSEQLERLNQIRQSGEREIGINPASREVRDPTNGLLLIYPISRFSGYNRTPSRNRIPIYENPEDQNSRDLICLAVSFPHSARGQKIYGEYLVGSVGWRPI